MRSLSPSLFMIVRLPPPWSLNSRMSTYTNRARLTTSVWVSPVRSLAHFRALCERGARVFCPIVEPLVPVPTPCRRTRRAAAS